MIIKTLALSLALMTISLPTSIDLRVELQCVEDNDLGLIGISGEFNFLHGRNEVSYEAISTMNTCGYRFEDLRARLDAAAKEINNNYAVIDGGRVTHGYRQLRLVETTPT